MSPDPREASLAEISRLLAESLDLAVVTRRITETVCELFRVHTAVLVTVDAGGGILGIGGAGPVPPAPFRLRRSSTLASVVIRDGVPHRTLDILDDPRVTPRPEDREVIARAGHRAVLCVPLLSRGRVIGALSLGDQTGRVYDDAEVRLAEAFAAQAAIALENARLYTEATTLAEVARVVGGAQSVTEVMRLLCREFSRLTGADTVASHFVDSVRRELLPIAGYRVPKQVMETLAGSTVPVDTSGLARTFLQGELVWSDDAAGDARLQPSLIAGRFPHRSGLALPLVFDGVVKGGFYLIWWTERYRPDEAMLNLLKAVAQQVGPFLKQAELMTELASTASRLRALAHTNQVISGTLDMQRVLTEIAGSAATLMQIPIVAFWTVEEEQRTVRIETFSDPSLREGFPLDSLPFGAGAVGWVAVHKAPLAMDDIEHDDRFVSREWWLARGYRSMYALPIMLDGTLLAVLTLNTREPLRLAPGDRELLDSFATQAALAIRNARLFQQAEVRRRMAEAAREHYRLLFERNLAGVLRTAADGRVLECNEALARILGYGSPADLIGHNVMEFWADAMPRTALIERLASDRRVTNQTIQFRRADGSVCWVLVNLSILGSGEDAVIEGVWLDVTDQRRAEQAERDVRALRSVASLANAAAHEINNPLAVIFGNLDMMKQRVITDAVLTNRVERALAAAQRISDSVVAMRKVTRIETAERQEDIPERLDLRASTDEPGESTPR